MLEYIDTRQGWQHRQSDILHCLTSWQPTHSLLEF